MIADNTPRAEFARPPSTLAVQLETPAETQILRVHLATSKRGNPFYKGVAEQVLHSDEDPVAFLSRVRLSFQGLDLDGQVPHLSKRGNLTRRYDGIVRVPTDEAHETYRVTAYVTHSKAGRYTATAAFVRDGRTLQDNPPSSSPGASQPGASQPAALTGFDARLEELRSFVAVHGRFPDSDDDKALARWIVVLKSRARTQGLPRDQQKRLAQIPGWTIDFAISNQSVYRDRIQAVRDLVSTAGRVAEVSYATEPFDVHWWLMTQWSNYRSGRLTAEQVADFEALSGWSWDRRHLDWELAASRIAVLCAVSNSWQELEQRIASDKHRVGHVPLSDVVRELRASRDEVPENIRVALGKLRHWTWDTSHANLDVRPLLSVAFLRGVLTEQETRVATAHYVRGEKFTDLARGEGLTREGVRQVWGKALAKALHPNNQLLTQALTRLQAELCEPLSSTNQRRLLIGEGESPLLLKLTRTPDADATECALHDDKLLASLLLDSGFGLPGSAESDEVVVTPVSGTDVTSLNLSTRTTNALLRAELFTLEQVRTATFRDLMGIRNFGRTCYDELRAALVDSGQPFEHPSHAYAPTAPINEAARAETSSAGLSDPSCSGVTPAETAGMTGTLGEPSETQPSKARHDEDSPRTILGMHLSQPNSHTLGSLLKQIDDGELRLPDLQRGYVWTVPKVVELVDSILRGYPVGGLLMWELDEKSDAAEREFAGVAPNFRTKKPRYLLDGQQRLTSLCKVRKGEIELLFHLVGLDEDGNPTSWVAPASAARRKDPLWIPLNDLWDVPQGQPLGVDLATRLPHASELQREAVRERLMHARYIFSSSHIHANVVTTDDFTLVADIFQRINSGDRALTSVDLAASTLSAR